MSLRLRLVVPCSVLALAAIAARSLPAQCANVWSPGEGLPGANGRVYASTLWDPDGAGPLPLSAIFAQGGIGCDVGIANGGAGVAESLLYLPNTPPLVGLTFFHQMIPFGFDTQGTLVSVEATNALQLTAGAF